MATLGHVSLGLLSGRLHVGNRLRGRRLALWLTLYGALAMLPDIDVIGFKLGVHYGDVWGHRGAAHSLLVAAAVAIGFALLVRKEEPRRPFALLCLLAFVAVGSHGLLDTLTNGGLGVELFWPWKTGRYFASIAPIRVAPIGLRMFSWRGFWVLAREALQFFPFWLFAIWPRRQPAVTGIG